MNNEITKEEWDLKTQQLLSQVVECVESKTAWTEIKAENARHLFSQWDNYLISSSLYVQKENDKNEKIKWRTIIKERKIYFKSLYEWYDFLETERKKKELLGQDINPNEIKIITKTNQEELINYGLGIQHYSKQSLTNSLRTLKMVKEIGESVVLKLEENTQTITRTHNELEQIESVVQRSIRIIKRIGRRIITYKYVCVLFWTLITMLIFLLIWNIYRN